MELHFTYTYADYREAVRVIRRPLAANKKSVRLESILAFAIGIISTIVFIALGNSQDQLRGSDAQSTYLNRFANAFFFWPVLIGVLWSLSIRRADLQVRRYTRLAFLLFAVGGLIFSALLALTPDAPTPPAPPPQSTSSAFLPLLPWIAIFVFVWAGVFVLLRLTAKIGWVGQKHLLQPYVIRISSDTLEAENPTMRTIYRWPAFLRFHETKNQFGLQFSKLSMVMIPKRACRDGLQVEELRRTLERHIAVADPRQIAFAVIVQPPP